MAESSNWAEAVGESIHGTKEPVRLVGWNSLRHSSFDLADTLYGSLQTWNFRISELHAARHPHVRVRIAPDVVELLKGERLQRARLEARIADLERRFESFADSGDPDTSSWIDSWIAKNEAVIGGIDPDSHLAIDMNSGEILIAELDPNKFAERLIQLSAPQRCNLFRIHASLLSR